MIEAEVLNRVLYNALLFSPTESVAGGVTQFLLSSKNLTVWSSDNYVILEQSTPASHPDGTTYEFYLNRKTMSELEKKTRSLQEEITVKELLSEEVQADNELFSDYRRVLGGFYQSEGTVFAINPDRMSKIARLKTDREYPIDFSYGRYEFGPAVGFKVGPKIVGLINPLDRQLIPQEGLWR